jgi:hypothetical protein
MKYFISELIDNKSKSQFPSIYIRFSVAATFLALLIAGPVLAQIPPPQKFALPKSEKNNGTESGNGRDADRNLSVSLQDTAQHKVLITSRMTKIGPKSAEEEVWCTRVDVKNGVFTFKGIEMRGWVASLSTPIIDPETMKNLKKECGYDFSETKTEDIRDFKQQRKDNIVKAHLIVEIKPNGKTVSAAVLIEADLNTEMSMTRVNIVDGRIISNNGEIFIGTNGTQVCATDKVILINLPGREMEYER